MIQTDRNVMWCNSNNKKFFFLQKEVTNHGFFTISVSKVNSKFDFLKAFSHLERKSNLNFSLTISDKPCFSSRASYVKYVQEVLTYFCTYSSLKIDRYIWNLYIWRLDTLLAINERIIFIWISVCIGMLEKIFMLKYRQYVANLYDFCVFSKKTGPWKTKN